MNDLISRSALIAAREKAIWVYENANIINADAIRENLKPLLDVVVDTPAVGAVEVVRCGECEKRNKSADLTDSIYCPWIKLQMRKTDFCSYGERRNGDA